MVFSDCQVAPPSKEYGEAWRATVSIAPLMVNNIELQAGWVPVLVAVTLAIIGAV